MNTRIILGLLLIVGASGAFVSGTTAFFSDTETSTGNTFTAGAIDLTVDNESFYNGVLNEGTTWTATDLTIEKFFDFDDVKPDDYGEDTISLHVATNDAYLCANVTLTSDDDNGINEPEAAAGDVTDGAGNGELADLMNFIWWADDGDNVLETDENVISQGPIGALTLNSPFSVSLADSVSNIWNPGNTPGPISGNTTYYIGKAWCFGTIGAAALDPDTYASGPAGDNNGNATAGEPEDGGITCDGTLLGNESQTDSLTADVSFEAVQSRHNPNFVCDECQFDSEVNLLTTSGFESPEVTNGAQWDIFPSPAAGWQVAWRSDIPATFGPQNRPAIANLELHEGVLGAAFEGDQYAELDTDWGGPSDSGSGEPASVVIYRDVPTTPGAQYTIHFAFAPRPNTPAADNDLEVRWGGVVVDALGPTAGGGGPIAWTPYDIVVTATSSVTRLQFTDLGTANSLGTFLDDVKLMQISCPGDEERAATLTLQKSVDNGTNGAAADTDWVLNASGPSNISGTEGSPAVTGASVTPGAYTLSESGGVPGYAASQYSCVVNGGGAVVGNNLALANGDTAVCTIMNTLQACTNGVVWADGIVMHDQGKRKNGTAILAARKDATKVLGPAETAGLPSDAVPPGSTFYSLGFDVGTTSTRSITVSFLDNVILNGPGNDVRIYEVTGGVYLDETATVQASQDGISWTTLVPNAIRDEDLDLGVLGWAKFIRVTDITAPGPFEAEADGYDVDAVRALNCAVPQV